MNSGLQEVKDTDRTEFERLYEKYKAASDKEKEYNELKKEYKKSISVLMDKLGYDSLIVPNLFTAAEQSSSHLDKDALIMELARKGIPAETVNECINKATKSTKPYKVIRPIKQK